LAHLTDQELLLERKKIKSSKTANGFLIGLFLGVAAFSAVRNGLVFATIFPLFFVFVGINNGRNTIAMEKELRKRDLS